MEKTYYRVAKTLNIVVFQGQPPISVHLLSDADGVEIFSKLKAAMDRVNQKTDVDKHTPIENAFVEFIIETSTDGVNWTKL